MVRVRLMIRKGKRGGREEGEKKKARHKAEKGG